ncbi:MAG: hypothetical protein LBB16_03685, partial [Puniceicoccales bacterium]|nr:hypothetical protein [Puniceicoccales bacterium]
MVDRLTGNTTYYVPISANIALGEVHIDSGLEGANQPKMDEQVKTWLTNLEFTRFAEAMGYSELEDISKHMGGLQKLDELVEGNVYLQGGGSILKLEQLINDKAPMSLFYCASTVGDGGNGHATNVSIAYNQTDCTWEVSFHNTGAGLNQATSIRNAEKCMCQCAYTFSELNDQQLRQLVRGILYIQKVETDEKYNSKCRDLYDGLVTYEKTDDSGETETVFVKKPNDPIHNYTFMRAQVGGNCTYASLNAMMRYLVLRKYGALNEASRGSENGKRASNAARVLDFFCRMKSMELAFENVKKGVCGPGEIRFLERILEANVCYFQKYIERRSKPEASDELAKIRSKFNDYRKEIHGAKIQCGINTSDSSSIEEGNLQNTHREIVEALPAPAEVKVYNARTTAVDPKLKELNNKLVEIRNIVAQGTPQATREAVKELAALCAAHTDSNYGEYIGNMVRSLVLNENFQVNIGEALGKDNTLCHGSLEDYYKIVKFLYALKEKNSENDTRGYYYPFSYYFKANSEESLSVDEQNVILTLQAHSLQIFRELVKRRDAAASRQVKLDPTEFVIDVPEIDGNDHVYDKRTVDRREKLRAFSCPNPVNGKFVVGGSGTPMCPNSVKAVFDSLLSGKDHADLLRNREQLQTNISETERTIKSSLEQLTNCRKDIIRAQRKDDVLINLNETKQKLQSQLAKLLEDKAASEIQAKRNDKLARIAELQKAIKDLESQKKNLEEDRAKAQMRQKFFPKSA